MEAAEKKGAAPPFVEPVPKDSGIEKKLFRMQQNNYELRQEVAELRALVALDEEVVTLESWVASGSQAHRDAFAARAIVAEQGSQVRALQRLGFGVMSKGGNWKPKVVAVLAREVLNTPGVRAILDRDLKGIDDAWLAILERQRQTALLGDDEQAHKSAALLAKVEGRYVDKAPTNIPTVSLHVLVNNANPNQPVEKQVEVVETHDPLAILAHEPSEVGVRTDSGDKFVAEALEG